MDFLFVQFHSTIKQKNKYLILSKFKNTLLIALTKRGRYDYTN